MLFPQGPGTAVTSAVYFIPASPCTFSRNDRCALLSYITRSTQLPVTQQTGATSASQKSGWPADPEAHTGALARHPLPRLHTWALTRASSHTVHTPAHACTHSYSRREKSLARTLSTLERRCAWEAHCPAAAAGVGALVAASHTGLSIRTGCACPGY